MTTLRRRLVPSLLVGGLLVLAVGPAAGAEPLPGPPARPGLPAIGGDLLTGSSLVMRPRAGVRVPPPPVSAATWVLADAVTGEVLAAKGPHLRYRPASTLKTLTSLTLMPRLNPSAVYTATEQDAAAEGSRVGLVPKATYTVDDLWHALLLPSANDAASALANANGGFARTVSEMNAEARRLQALDIVAKTPSGLDAPGQYVSAYDLALLGRAALAMPSFVRVSGTTTYQFPGGPAKAGHQRTSYTIYGENRLLNHGFRGTIAGKNGYTTQARRTFWVAVKRGNRTLIASLLRIGTSTEEGAKALITWGFAHADQLEPVGTLVPPVSPSPTPVPATPDATVGPAPEAGGGSGGGSGVQAATVESRAVSGSSPSGGRSWAWLLLPVAIVVGGVAALRARAVSRRRSRAGAVRATPRTGSWGT